MNKREYNDTKNPELPSNSGDFFYLYDYNSGVQSL